MRTIFKFEVIDNVEQNLHYQLMQHMRLIKNKLYQLPNVIKHFYHVSYANLEENFFKLFYLGYNFDAITCESCKAFFRRNALRPVVMISFP
jgi:hypothetical protein